MSHLKDALIRKIAFDRRAAIRQRMLQLQAEARKRKPRPVEVKGAPLDSGNVANKKPMQVSTADPINPRGNTRRQTTTTPLPATTRPGRPLPMRK